jgi:hypothetical protein
MEELLQEVKILPNVIGTFVYTEKNDTIFPDLPKLFMGKDLSQIGRSLTKVFKLNAKTNQAANTLEMLYNESLILVKQIDTDSCLVVICEPSVNLPLVTMTTSMLVSDLKSAIANALKAPPIKKTAPPIKEAAPSAPKAPEPKAASKQNVDIDQLINEGPLSETFKQFQNALARAIGPIGKMVMKEVVEQWAKEGECSAARFKDLTDMLCEEIGNTNLEKEFRDEIKSIL